MTFSATVIDIGFAFKIYDDQDNNSPIREAMFWVKRMSFNQIRMMIMVLIISTLNSLFQLILKPTMRLYRLPIIRCVFLIKLPNRILYAIASEYVDSMVSEISLLNGV